MEGTEENAAGAEEGAVGGAEAAEESPDEPSLLDTIFVGRPPSPPLGPLYRPIFRVGKWHCCLPREAFFEHMFERVFKVRKRRVDRYMALFEKEAQYEYVKPEVKVRSSHKKYSEDYMEVAIDPDDPTSSISHSYFHNIDPERWTQESRKKRKKAKKQVRFEEEEVLTFELDGDGSYTNVQKSTKLVPIDDDQVPCRPGPGPKTGVIPKFRKKTVRIPAELEPNRYRNKDTIPIKKVDPESLGKFKSLPSSKKAEFWRKACFEPMPPIYEPGAIPVEIPPPVSAATLLYKLKSITEKYRPLEIDTPHEPNLLHALNEVAIDISEPALPDPVDDTIIEVNAGGVQVTAQVHRSSEGVAELPLDETTRGAHIRLSRGISYRTIGDDDDDYVEVVRVTDNVNVRVPVAQEADQNTDLVVRWSSSRPGVVGAEADEIENETVTVDVNVEPSEREQMLAIPRSQVQRSLHTAVRIVAVYGVPFASFVGLTVYFIIEGLPNQG